MTLRTRLRRLERRVGPAHVKPKPDWTLQAPILTPWEHKTALDMGFDPNNPEEWAFAPICIEAWKRLVEAGLALEQPDAPRGSAEGATPRR